ncbi:MAG: hypothetical protein COT00_03730 [Candidatus Omnitrophica bacterium CG07_land_8_20_14_0_80_50_8]|nr:MAG: hypothetical protein COT00_03730 [Candidatus Omnitrophica bacterium CG07_land_8_20_14_0_80_50_8]
MKREILKKNRESGFGALSDPCSNIESFKRRQTLRPFWSLDISSRLFFERVLHVKRASEVIFLTKSQSKNR